jgi:hypothetical protein
MITKPAANEWMTSATDAGVAFNRYKGMQKPVTGNASQQRKRTSLVKAVECNFAHRGAHYLENHGYRESNSDFPGATDNYEFDVDGTIGSDVMVTGDKEAVFRFDRVPEVSNLRQGFVEYIQSGMMPSYIESQYTGQWKQGIPKKQDSDYTRSIYSANTVLHIIDPDLGVIKVDSYGNVM